MNSKISRQLIIIFGLLVLASPLNCRAEKIGFAIDQTVFNLSADPGEKLRFDISASNISSTQQQMSATSLDYVISDDNLVTILEDGSNELYGMKDWVKVKEHKWLVEPEDTHKMEIEIHVPQDATVGSHYTFLMVQALPQIDFNNFQQPVVGGRVAVHLLINVKGEVSGAGVISNFMAPILADKNLSFRAEFQNTGNIHYVPHGEIVLENLLTGKETKKETEKHFVFPGKKYAFDLTTDLPSVLGIYTAKAYFVDGDQAVHTSSRIVLGKFFFVIPIVTIAAILALYKFYRKSQFRKQKIQSGNENKN